MTDSPAPRLLALAGSLRRGSHNRRLLGVAVGLAREQGAEIDLVALGELGLPFYDGDLEAASGLPAPVVAFQQRIARAEGLLLACPEYNHSIPGVFKNAIDWASRPPGNPFPDKVAALLGASTGAGGAIRALAHLRQVLASRGVWVVPSQVSVPFAQNAFDEAGVLRDEATQRQVARVVAQLIAQIRRARVGMRS